MFLTARYKVMMLGINWQFTTQGVIIVSSKTVFRIGVRVGYVNASVVLYNVNNTVSER